MAQHPEQFSIPSLRSEIEFLHGFEACSGSLDYADKTLLLSRRGNEVLSLWKRLGRPHPVVLRTHLLGLWHWANLPDSVDLREVEDFLDWSCTAYAAVCSADLGNKS